MIADDEPLARRKLRRLLVPVPWIDLVAESADGPSALHALSRCRPNLVFLDIRMPGLSGMEVLARSPHHPMIVFTTAHSDYAVTAFELEAFDYLLKPFGRKRLRRTLERVRQHVERVEAGVPALEANEERYLQRLLVRDRQQIVPLAVRDIVRIEARDDFVRVHTTDGNKLAAMRMVELEERLPPGVFVRIHRSHIVNLDRVVNMSQEATGRLLVTMNDGAKLRASRARSQALKRGTF